jgi:hydrogenase maturation protease
MTKDPERVMVLALGNVLRRDEGLGIRALQRLEAEYLVPESVQAIDGGTLGLELLSLVEDATHLLVLDALLVDGPPGTVGRLANDKVPRYFGIRTSPHEIGLPDLLAVTELRGLAPSELVVLGLRPGSIELGWYLSEAVAARLDTLVEAAATELRRWGVILQARSEGKEPTHA